MIAPQIDPLTGMMIMVTQSTPEGGGGGGGGVPGAGVKSVVAGANVTVDNTDPRNPVVSSTGGGGGVTDIKESVRAATTVAGVLATSFENLDVIDGVTLATGDRILIKDQAAGAENGIYTVNSSGAPTRATDADTSAEVTAGMYTFVSEGTTNADSGFVLATNDPITLGVTALVFTQFPAQITAGAGLTKTGNTIDAVGTANRIVVAANTIDIGSDVATLSGVETFGGAKTFTLDPIIPDEVYGAGWNGSLEPPTKNAVYDKIETLGGASSVDYTTKFMFGGM